MADDFTYPDIPPPPVMPNFAPRFGTGDGKVLTKLGSQNDSGRSVALQADGRIVLGGSVSNGTDFDFALVRYNADGSLDTGFGSGGVVRTSMGTGISDVGNSIAIQSDGRILLGGYKTSGSTGFDFVVARYNTDGTLDMNFGAGGKAVPAVSSNGDGIASVVIQPDNKILLGGYAVRSDYDFALVRLNTDSSLDTGFGSSGRVVTGVSTTGTKDDQGNAVALQGDGNGGFKIIMAGTSRIGNDDDFALVRYNANGSLDTSFGSGGKKTMNFIFGPNADEVGRGVVVQADGKIIVGGTTLTNGTYDFALARFERDGSLDTSFGTNGRVATPLGSSLDIANSIVLQPNGKILLGGYTYGSGNEFALVRYNRDGSLDTGFGSGGKVVTPSGTGTDEGRSIALQPDGKILLGGSGGAGYGFGLVRYNPDGSLDLGFSTSRFTEGGAPVVADSDAAAYDHNLANSNYGGALVTLTRAEGARGEDVFGASGTLAALVQGGDIKVGAVAIGTVTQNSGGVLSLAFNTSTTQALLDAALRQITYANTSDAPPGAVSLKWTFNDGNANEVQGAGGPGIVSALSTVLVTGVNDAAAIGGDVSPTFAETDAILSASGTLLVSDPDSPASFQAGTLTSASGATLALQAGGAYTYTASSPHNELAAGAAFTDTFTVRSADGTAANVVITVAGTNDAPVLVQALADRGAKEDKSFRFTLPSGSFADAEGGALSVSATRSDGSALPSWLKFDAATLTFSGRAPANFHGSRDFTVTASDGQASVSDTFRLTVAPVNDAPRILSNKAAAKATLSLAENKAGVASLKASDVDSKGLTWSLSGGADAKLFAINAKTGALAFKAAPDFESRKDAGRNNTYDVTVKVSDGKAADFQALSIKVTDVKGIAKSGNGKANTLVGAAEADTLKGAGGNDTLKGLGGNDRLSGGAGADKLYGGGALGGAGLDVFVFSSLSDSTVSARGRDTIFDFAHGDRIDLRTIDANAKADGNQAFSWIEAKKFGGHAGELRFEKLKSDTVVYADVNGDKRADFAVHLDDALKLVKADFLL